MNKQEFIEKVRHELKGLSPQPAKTSHLVCIAESLEGQNFGHALRMFRFLHAFGDVVIEDYQVPEMTEDIFIKVHFTPRKPTE